MTKLLTLGILFSTAVRGSPLTSFILALRVVLVAKLVISGILSSIFLILALYASFLTTQFCATSFNLLKSTGASYLLYFSNCLS